MSAIPFDLVLRSGASASNTIEADRYVSGRQWKMDPDSAVELILSISGQADTAVSKQLVEPGPETRYGDSAHQHWYERKWAPADRQYIAASETHFRDGADHSGEDRMATVAGMLQKHPSPVSPSTLSDRLRPRTPATIAFRELSRLLQSRSSGRSYVRSPIPEELLLTALKQAFDSTRSNRIETDEAEPVSIVANSFGSAWDVYVVVYSVDGMQPGVYLYDVLNEKMTLQRSYPDESSLRTKMSDVLQGQRPPHSAGFTVLLVANFPRYQWRYRHEQALRCLYIESGVIGQWLIMSLWRSGVSSLVTPAQKDSTIAEILELDTVRQAVVTTLTCGWSRGAAGSRLE